VFVASANERVIDGARRILVNEFEGEELRKHLALEALVPHMPIRTIAQKTKISEAVVAHGPPGVRVVAWGIRYERPDTGRSPPSWRSIGGPSCLASPLQR
jgi:hypothetical protein